MSDLHRRMLAAHAKGDRPALVALNSEAAEAADTETARGFFLTHAYVFALEAGLPVADELRAELRGMGRED